MALSMLLPACCSTLRALHSQSHRTLAASQVPRSESEGTDNRRVNDDIPIVHDTQRRLFAAAVGGAEAVCAYRLDGQVLVLHHTEVPAALQGQGIAALLVQAALDWARQEGLVVRPLCSYVASFMRRHPETQDLLQPRE
jgi:uncharacterized protein